MDIVLIARETGAAAGGFAAIYAQATPEIVARNQRSETDIHLAGTTLDFIAFFPHFVNNN